MTFEEYVNGIISHTGAFTDYRKIVHLGKRIKNRYLFKYMDIDTAINYCLNPGNNTLKFAQLSQWPDKYEERFYNASYYKIIRAQEYDEKIPRLYACCFTTTPASELSWKTYSYNKTGRGALCVQFKINLKKLRKVLNTFAGVAYDIYEAPLFYKPDYEISRIHYKTINGNPNPTYDLFFTGFSRKKFLSLLSLKRDAFMYEKEMRYFIVPKDQAAVTDNLFVNIQLSSIVEGVMITDDCPVVYEHQLRAALEDNGMDDINIERFDLYKKKERRITIGEER